MFEAVEVQTTDFFLNYLEGSQNDLKLNPNKKLFSLILTTVLVLLVRLYWLFPSIYQIIRDKISNK
jgi:NhaP-type Na+/H+ or K+/H+ antiporter